MQSIIRHIILERRRLTLIGVLSFAAGFTLYSHMGVTPKGVPVPIVTGLIYMLAVVLAAAVTTFILPRLRRITDAVAVTRLGFAIWVAATQNYDLVSSPIISASIVVGAAILLVNAGAWLPVITRKLSGPAEEPSAFQTVREFLVWLDNAAGYQANTVTGYSREPRRAYA